MSLKLGAYTACLHDRTLDETLKILGELGLASAEILAGPSPDLLREAYAAVTAA